jgi:hypothetical protein
MFHSLNHFFIFGFGGRHIEPSAAHFDRALFSVPAFLSVRHR